MCLQWIIILIRTPQKRQYGINLIYSRGTFPNTILCKSLINNEFGVRVQGSDVEGLNSFKLLGVIINNKLNFSEHVNITCKKACQRIGVLMRLRNLVPSLRLLFKAAILPYLTYCHLTWYFCRASDEKKLERIQERGLRAVFRDSKSTYEKLLSKAKLITLYERRFHCLLQDANSS